MQQLVLAAEVDEVAATAAAAAAVAASALAFAVAILLSKSAMMAINDSGFWVISMTEN